MAVWIVFGIVILLVASKLAVAYAHRACRKNDQQNTDACDEEKE